jgi:uncharacterized protein YybS (DUF2232 family)
MYSVCYFDQFWSKISVNTQNIKCDKKNGPVGVILFQANNGQVIDFVTLTVTSCMPLKIRPYVQTVAKQRQVQFPHIVGSLLYGWVCVGLFLFMGHGIWQSSLWEGSHFMALVITIWVWLLAFYISFCSLGRKGFWFDMFFNFWRVLGCDLY